MPVITDRRRQRQRVAQALDRRDGARLQNDAVGDRLHAEHADAPGDELRQHDPAEAPIVRVHHVERHLHRVEGEAVGFGDGKRVQMDVRILVTGEADVAQLAGLARLHERRVRAVVVEHAVRVLVAKYLVMLHQVDAVGLEAPQRLVS